MNTDKHRFEFSPQPLHKVVNLRLICLNLCSLVFLCGLMFCDAAAQQTQPGTASRSKLADSVSSTGDRNVVARVNDQPIYKQDVDRALEAVSSRQQINSDQMPQFQAAMLAQLISQRLVFEYIKQQDLVATPQEIDTRIDQISEQLKAQNSSLTQLMRQSGLTRAALRNRIGNEVSLQKLLSKYGKEETVQAYFKRHARQFDGTELRVSHILLRPKGSGNQAEMDEVRVQAARIKADIESDKISFADAAKQYSAGPSRSEGGDLGFIRREGPMVEAFNHAAFDLEKGHISEPVATPFGMHLITVTEVKPGGKTLEEVRSKVMPAFSQWLVDQLIEEEIKKAKIEFNENFPHYKPGTRELAATEK
jgi:parvulin-like peptidyl-prolyl isomerase